MNVRLNCTDEVLLAAAGAWLWPLRRAAQEAGVPHRTLRSAVDRGSIPSVTVGRLVLVPKRSVMAWKQRRRKRRA